MRKNFLGLTAFIILITLPLVISAQGLSVYELGARAATLGGAFVARADDVSTIYYNPAGLAYLEGFQIKANIMYGYLTSTAFNPTTNATYTSSPLQIRGQYYLSLKPTGWLSFGIGIFNPYFNQTAWPWSWPGRALSASSRINTYFIRPSVALKIFEGLALGFGLDIVQSKMEWMHAQAIQWPSFRNYYDSRTYVKGRGTGYSAGILIKPLKNFRIGAKYQQEIKIDMKGNNQFYPFGWEDDPWLPDVYLDPNPITMRYGFQGNVYPATSQITIPAEMAVGVFYAPIRRVSFQLDFQKNNWSSIRKWWAKSGDSETPFSQIAYLNWKDSWKIKFGVEFFLNDYFSIRGGYSRSDNPVPDGEIHPVSPTFGQKVASFGLGYQGPFFSIWDYEKSGELSFDIFFQYYLSDVHTSSLPGFNYDYDADRWLIGVGFGLNF